MPLMWFWTDFSVIRSVSPMPAFDSPCASRRSTAYCRSVSRETADPARGATRSSSAGSSVVRPSAAARTAVTSVAASVDEVFDRYDQPAATSGGRSRSRSIASCADSSRMPRSGWCRRSVTPSAMPLPSGRSMSSTATSAAPGRSAAAPSLTVPTEATTRMSSAAPRVSSSMDRNRGWSSTTTTRVVRAAESDIADSMVARPAERATARGRPAPGPPAGRTAAMPTPLTLDAAAVRADRRTLLLAAGTIMTVFAVGAAAQTAWVYGNQGGMVPVGTRILANLTAVASMLVILAVTGVSLPQRGRLAVVVGVLSAGVTASGVRFAFQLLLQVYEDPSRQVISAELASGAVVAWIAATMGLAAMLSQRKLRTEVAERAQARLQIELALAALQHEEVRVRREVAEGLHGSMQQRLVLVVARLDALLAELGEAGDRRAVTAEDVALLREVREQIETVREADVRTTSRMLYPEQLEVGIEHP